MEHALNLADYCRRRAAVAAANGDHEKAARLIRNAEHWEAEAKAS